MIDHLVITTPDDWHHHFRDGDRMNAVTPIVAKHFARAIAMPNLVPPVCTADHARAYRDRLMQALPENSKFQPLMTLYLTDNTSPEDITTAKESGIVFACKLYPAGATTNSSSGVTDIKHVIPALTRMQEIGMPLLVHGEVTDPDTDLFDREALFIQRVLIPLMQQLPKLKIVMEHITTKEAAEFVSNAPDNIAATITCHHLLYNRNAIFRGGVRPHMYCLPVLKREEHRKALLQAIGSGSKKFFLGTDSAPHPRVAKECECCSAGVFTMSAIELYAEAFDSINALDKLEAFASFNGPDFYGLPRNSSKITLKRQALSIPKSIPFGGTDELVPLRGGETVAWTVVSE